MDDSGPDGQGKAPEGKEVASGRSPDGAVEVDVSNLNPRQFHPIYRGLHVPLSGPEASDDEVLGRIKRMPPPNADEKFERERLQVDPESVNKWPIYGRNWTAEEHVAKTFAMREGTNMGYAKRGYDKARTGVVLEAHSQRAPEPDRLMSGYGESQIRWPGRDAITGVTAHIHHYPEGARQFVRGKPGPRQQSLVRSFPLPPEHWKTPRI